MSGFHTINVLDKSWIPAYTMMALEDYVRNHTPKGGFMEAVLTNNLKEAFARADQGNLMAIGAMVNWLYNEAPSTCWGSPEKYEAWINMDRGPESVIP